ncbi:DUF1127 domain-containing protein [Mesorhizobium robiniae]|uniref:DUF1127 domain-containing protein n=1 Tax=Mesorhizobium robiniae TaxID=559315 RepID=UPI003396DF6B
MTLEFQIAEIPERLARGLLTKLPALRFGACWWQRSETEHALHRLSDRDLADIGIARRDIREFAWTGTVAASERRNRSPAAAMDAVACGESHAPSGWVEALADPFRDGSRINAMSTKPRSTR